MLKKVNKLKVIFVVKALGSGGIENYLLRFIKYSNETIEAHVLCTGGVESHLDKAYNKNGVSIIYLKIGYLPTFEWFNYLRLLRKSRFDAIVDFTGDFASLTLIGARVASIKKRIVFYRNSRYTFTETPLKLMYAKCSNFLVKIFSTKILSNSKAALDYFHPSWIDDKGNYEVISNGVPAEPYLRKVDKRSLRENFRIPNKAFVVGHVGRHGPGKNHDLILEVAIELCQRHEDVYFLLCGKGVKEARGTEIIDLSLQDRIIMPGVVDNIPDVLQIMDIFFFPSTVEGQPNALIEAMLSNLPIVASDIAPINECVPPKLNDSLISLHSGADAFSKKIDNLYLSRSKRVESDTSSWAKNAFSPDKNFAKFLNQLV